jgi:formylmethanofuran dehydrogenase subunit B
MFDSPLPSERLPLSTGPVVCAGCGAVCDDILLNKPNKLCGKGIDFMQKLPGFTERAWSQGHSITQREAITQARQLLRAAKAPGIFGLTLVTVEAVTAAVQLARQFSAWLSPWPPDPIRFWGQHAPDLALSRAELEQAADLVLYLGFEQGVDAVQPRHRERHLSRGLGLGRKQLDILWPPATRLQNLIQLRLHLERQEPISDELKGLADAITSSRCMQVFFKAQLASDDPRYVEQWQHLAAQQRQHRRMGISLLGSTGKARTVTEALTWLTGYPGPLLFADNTIRYLPDVGEVKQLIQNQAIDTILWLGTRPTYPVSNVKQIVIATDPPHDVDVTLEVPGVAPQLDAHLVRGDGVMLRLAGNNHGQPDPMATLLALLIEAQP